MMSTSLISAQWSELGKFSKSRDTPFPHHMAREISCINLNNKMNDMLVYKWTSRGNESTMSTSLTLVQWSELGRFETITSTSGCTRYYHPETLLDA